MANTQPNMTSAQLPAPVPWLYSAKPVQTMKIASTMPATAPVPGPARRRILVVDDDEAVVTGAAVVGGAAVVAILVVGASFVVGAEAKPRAPKAKKAVYTEIPAPTRALMCSSSRCG